METKKLLFIAIVVVIGVALFFHQSYPKPRINALVIYPVNCSDCYNMTPAIDQLEKLGAIVKTTTIYYPRDISKKELLNNNISRLPVIIFSGELTKYPRIVDFLDLIDARFSDELMSKKAIVIAPEPIYYDLMNDSPYGYVDIVEIKPPSCNECNNMSQFRREISHLCYISRYRVADYNTELAQELIKRYNITRLPAVVLSPEANQYKILSMNWGNVGITSKDGYLVTTSLTPPFYSIPLHRVVGVVNITYLYDPECKSCYNYSLHRVTLERFNVKIGKEKVVSIHSKEGKELIKKYNITAIPTFIASPDLRYYTALMKVWDQVGSIDNGYFIFRNMKKMPGRVYLNLTTNTTMIGG